MSLGIWTSSSSRTRHGDSVLNNLIDSSQELKVDSNDSDSQLSLAFALFGTKVIASDSALADLRPMLAPSNGSSNSNNSLSSFSGGDSGWGGDSGCGGCGG